jgi:aminoglycoside phosphotransferase (APT) family kinase protein
VTSEAPSVSLEGPLGQVDLGERLVHWARHEYGAEAHVPEVWPMPGNAGLSFGFDVVVDGTAGGRWPLVIRLAPPGVRRRGNTDVLRQVPLLRSLQDCGIPVAPVTWSTGDPQWFGTDVVIQQRLQARPLHMWESTLSHPDDIAGTQPFVRQAVDTLAAIHAVPWTASLQDWEPMRTVGSEVAFWHEVLSKADDPSWVEAGEKLRDVLLDTQPESPRCGIFHGDYQTNNVLYDDSGRLVAVVDWEISGLGPQLLDLGWLTLFTDTTCWDASYVRGMRVVTEPAQLLRQYEEAAERQVERFDWFRAFACFRFGAIAAFNVRLHRTGRRVDANWDRIAPSVSTLFERGRSLAQS